MDVIAVFLLGVVGGGINAVAGGGPIIVVAALVALGTAADVANLTSTVALLPGQLATGWRSRASLTVFGQPSRRRIGAAIAIIGGAAGAGLLLVTPGAVFARILPFLIAFATALYAWNSRSLPDASTPPRQVPRTVIGWLAPLAVYGGFYGGGNSFMVLALLAHGKVGPRAAIHVKNLLILLMNAAATVIFVASGKVDWIVALPLGLGALLGAAIGAALIDRLDPVWLRRLVIVLGASLAVWLVLRD